MMIDTMYIEETNLLGAAGLLDQGEVDSHPRRARVAAPYLVWAKSASSIFNRLLSVTIDMSYNISSANYP